MSAQHTQGRLEVHAHTYAIADTGDYDSVFEIWDNNGKAIAWFGGTDSDEANARRIVACWNACEGIRTEALEHRAHLLKAHDDELATLTTQRDKLLAALIEAREALQMANETPNGPITGTIWMWHRPETLFDFIDAAIAEVKGA
jgi:hypothetical protein